MSGGPGKLVKAISAKPASLICFVSSISSSMISRIAMVRL